MMISGNAKISEYALTAYMSLVLADGTPDNRRSPGYIKRALDRHQTEISKDEAICKAQGKRDRKAANRLHEQSRKRSAWFNHYRA